MQEMLNKIEQIIEEELPSCCNANYMKDGCVYKMKNVIAKAEEIIRAEQSATDINVAPKTIATDSSKTLCKLIDKIGVEVFVNYLNMIFDDTQNSMKEKYEEDLENTGDMNLAIIECIEDDLSYA